MSIVVRKPGLLSTVQDAGRFGWQRYGVIVSGAMDPHAHAMANILVGNEQSDAALELTMSGPTLFFEQAHLIAICGADMNPTIQGFPVPMDRPVYVPAGTELMFGSVPSGAGCRCYLALAGGLKIEKVMGSYATYLRAGFGGYKGRALQAEDRLEIRPRTQLGMRLFTHLERKYERQAGDTSPFLSVEWQASRSVMPAYAQHPTLHYVPGLHADLFEEESIAALEEGEYRVSPQSDRMGYRLTGTPLRLRQQTSLLSEAVTFGTVQVPADGCPIILGVDRQTTGGYPVIAQIISADLPLLAQAQVGSIVRFRKTDLADAEKRLLEQQSQLEQLKASIRAYIGSN